MAETELDHMIKELVGTKVPWVTTRIDLNIYS